MAAMAMAAATPPAHFITNANIVANGKTVSATNKIIAGDRNAILGNDNLVHGNYNTVTGNANVVYGFGNRLVGNHCRAQGTANSIVGQSAEIIELDSSPSADLPAAAAAAEREIRNTMKQAFPEDWPCVGTVISHADFVQGTTINVGHDSGAGNGTHRREGTDALGGRAVPLVELEGQPVATDADEACCVCAENETDIVLLPCAHLCCYVDCARNLGTAGASQAKCPICRAHVTHAFKVYSSCEK